jgi:hypothetical protein
MIDQERAADRPPAHEGADRAAKVDLAVSAGGPAQQLSLRADGPARQVLSADGPAEPGPVEQAVRAGATEQAAATPPREIGGRSGPDPTRYGDWELRGRCIDF